MAAWTLPHCSPPPPSPSPSHTASSCSGFAGPVFARYHTGVKRRDFFFFLVHLVVACPHARFVLDAVYIHSEGCMTRRQCFFLKKIRYAESIRVLVFGNPEVSHTRLVLLFVLLSCVNRRRACDQTRCVMRDSAASPKRRRSVLFVYSSLMDFVATLHDRALRCFVLFNLHVSCADHILFKIVGLVHLLHH